MTIRIKAIWIFLLLAALQLLVPASMIYQRETTLTHGVPYRFKTAPVDPYDPFRGRFVRLNVEAGNASVEAGAEFKKGQWAYVLLGKDEQGFAMLKRAHREPPAAGDYLRLKVRSASGKTVRLKMPFDRFYAEESIAPEIERAYRRSSRRGRQDAFVMVRVKDGRGVIEELYIEDLPILEFLAREPGQP
ncbi:MAG: hypothetical protein C0617_03530 [Desulfuromonas sp.]|uniref:GDYXXLXY domain-containing protein n=1 Tax=Desulfuromonas sp. TaxID=892 RepID=UPI000CAC6181|nr:GDYXXLXY domain-containing protein [Desulfuromonas sp.]PLX85580.1 MAG: hypothetical protein C0617_03530 [Desulfuromonas sp.]